MIEKLTPEQEALIPVVRDKWLNVIKTPLNKEKAIEAVTWLYSFCGYATPEIVFAASPWEAQKIANERCGTKNQYYSFSWYGSVGDSAWVAFYNYFESIIAVNSEPFQKYKNILLAGIYDMIQWEKLCVVIGNPIEIHRNEANQLHRIHEKAIFWENGDGSYRLFGVNFMDDAYDLFCKICNGSLTYQEVFQIGNMEHQRVALAMFGEERLLSECNAKLIDKSEKGNELYFTDALRDLVDEDVYFLKYSCPSTKRVYVSFVSPDDGETKDADFCMAKKGGWTKEEYLNIGVET